MALALRPAILVLVKDVNGNHVVQRALHCFNPENRQMITAEVCGHCVEVRGTPRDVVRVCAVVVLLRVHFPNRKLLSEMSGGAAIRSSLQSAGPGAHRKSSDTQAVQSPST